MNHFKLNYVDHYEWSILVQFIERAERYATQNPERGFLFRSGEVIFFDQFE